MVNADDRLAGNRPSERHRAARRRQHGFASFGGKINTTMPGTPDDGWQSELPLYRGRRRGVASRQASEAEEPPRQGPERRAR